MSKLPPELLLHWSVPLWRQRRGVPDFLQRAENPPAPEPAQTGPAAHFSGFFVPETLSEAAEALLANILRACPWLGERHDYADVAAPLSAESGQAWVFGEPDWWESADELPVRCIQLPDLDAMLEEPLLKKQAYLTLLKARDGEL